VVQVVVVRSPRRITFSPSFPPASAHAVEAHDRPVGRDQLYANPLACRAGQTLFKFIDHVRRVFDQGDQIARFSDVRVPAPDAKHPELEAVLYRLADLQAQLGAAGAEQLLLLRVEGVELAGHGFPLSISIPATG
jgi:hypothetical protein